MKTPKNSQRPASPKPDWDSFEREEEEYLEIKNPMLAAIFHWGMIAVLVAIVFGVCGAMFLVFVLRVNNEAAMHGTNGYAIGAFVLGGFLGVGALAAHHFKQDEP